MARKTPKQNATRFADEQREENHHRVDVSAFPPSLSGENQIVLESVARTIETTTKTESAVHALG